MANFKWVEVFISLEGESLYCGYPTVYVRLTNCNFTCKGFNNDANEDITNDVLGFDPADYSNLKDIPIITKGCDSLYAHDKRFAHLWKSGDESELAQELVNLLPDKQWYHPETGLPYILSITGGEPTLYQKQIPVLLNHPMMEDLKVLLIETNCSVPLRDSFINELNKWKDAKGDRQVVWSNSPKLSASGERWELAIKPDIALKQLQVKDCIQYFKFVVGPRDNDFTEVKKAMDEYYNIGISRSTLVGIMPESCTYEQQNDISTQVADMCIKKGYVYVCRLQNYLWGNEVGT